MMSTVILSLLSVMVALNLIGNSLVCLVVLRDRSMKTTMNFLLVNLAIADMIVGIFSTFRFVINDIFKNLQGTSAHASCSLLSGGSFMWVGMLASVLFLVVIAVERYHAVVHPLGHQTGIVPARLKTIVSACWVYAFVWNLPATALRRYNEENDGCFVSWPHSFLAKISSIWWVTMTGVVPVGIMGFLYFQIVRNLWESVNPGSIQQAANARARKKVTLMALIVSVIYILTWVPNSIIFLLLRFSSLVEPDSPADQLGILLVTFNSCINPIVYSLHGTPFSKRLKNMIFCCRPTTKRNTVMPSEVVVSRNLEQEIHDSSYRNENFVENGIESRSMERSK